MRIILHTNKATGTTEAFTSLKPFFKKYPFYKRYKSAIDENLSRKKGAFETEIAKVQRLTVQNLRDIEQ